MPTIARLVATGPQVEANVPAATEILSQGLKSWPTDFKATAEAAH
ncbi:hypothetical protein [Streptomyces niveus]